MRSVWVNTWPSGSPWQRWYLQTKREKSQTGYCRMLQWGSWEKHLQESSIYSYLPPVWEARSCRNLLATLKEIINKNVNHSQRTVITRVLKVIRFWFSLHEWFKNTWHCLNQSEVKPKPIVIRFPALSVSIQQSFASSFDWFTGLSVSFVIEQSHYFDSGFTTVEKSDSYRVFTQLNLQLRSEGSFRCCNWLDVVHVFWPL